VSTVILPGDKVTVASPTLAAFVIHKNLPGRSAADLSSPDLKLLSMEQKLVFGLILPTKNKGT
jgi:hypothetical protein